MGFRVDFCVGFGDGGALITGLKFTLVMDPLGPLTLIFSGNIGLTGTPIGLLFNLGMGVVELANVQFKILLPLVLPILDNDVTVTLGNVEVRIFCVTGDCVVVEEKKGDVAIVTGELPIVENVGDGELNVGGNVLITGGVTVVNDCCPNVVPSVSIGFGKC